MHAAKAKWQRASSQPLQCYLERQQSVALTPTKKDLAHLSLPVTSFTFGILQKALVLDLEILGILTLAHRLPSPLSLSHSLSQVIRLMMQLEFSAGKFP